MAGVRRHGVRGLRSWLVVFAGIVLVLSASSAQTLVFGKIVRQAAVFAQPRTDATSTENIPAGVTVVIVARQGDWYHVAIVTEPGNPAELLGWIRKDTTELLPKGAPAPVTSAPEPNPSSASAPKPPVASPPAESTRPEPERRPASPSPAAGTRRPKDITIRGYVTGVRSATDFDIEDYRITRDEELAFNFENASPELKFELRDIRVGVELEIKGAWDAETGDLKAKSIKVDMEQFKPTKQTAMVSVAPEGIQRQDGRWSGSLRADGQLIRVTDATVVAFKPTKREQRLAEAQSKKPTGELTEFEPLTSLDQVTVGMVMTYEGTRDRESGAIVATRVEFSSNDLEDGEARLWKSLKATTTQVQGLTPGELKIDQVGKFKLLPSQQVQDYVAAIGQSLIPPYQRDLAQDDPRRIPFEFHVVQDKSTNAFATPNGIVVVNSGLLQMIENEAQLAAIVGHEIAHATQEHTWRQQQYHQKSRFGVMLAGALAGYGLASLSDLANMVNGAIVNGHQRTLENQSDRVGLEYMVAAGYDPREAPAVWKLMAKTNGVSSTNFWSSHDNAPTRRSYLMNELKNNYRDLDYSALRKNEGQFSQIKTAVDEAASPKVKVKVTQ